jgi:hypothetical protein
VSPQRSLKLLSAMFKASGRISYVLSRGCVKTSTVPTVLPGLALISGYSHVMNHEFGKNYKTGPQILSTAMSLEDGDEDEDLR